MGSVTGGQARRRRLAGVAMVVVVLILGCLTTVGATVAVQRGRQQLTTQAMDHNIQDVSAAIADEVSHYADALTYLSVGITSQEHFTYADFMSMTATLNRRRLPGASGLGFVVPAFDGQTAETQAYWRARGASGLHLSSSRADVEHKFVVFSRSFDGAHLSPGRDLSENPESEDMLRTARKTGAFTVGSAHVLLRDRTLPASQQQMAFTVAVPVFGRPGSAESRRVTGWITMGIRGSDFLSETLRNKAQGTIQLRLTDPSGDIEKVIVAITDSTPMDSPGLRRHRVLVVGQRNWDLSMRPTIRLLSAADRRSAELTLVAGLVVTLLLAVLVAVLAGTRARAMGQVDAATGALRKDIERRQALEHELQRLAFHDPLTGLANRSLYYDRVEHALRSHARDERGFAVFFIDLDGFKQVNDEFGHSAGDIVLREVAHRLRGCLRDGDTVARFGGDEFAVIMERLSAPGDVHLTAERIVEAVQLPIDVGRRPVTVTASVGVALNRAGDTADDILRAADLAMYTAKTTGKCRHVLAVPA